jgi:hypothetical protein
MRLCHHKDSFSGQQKYTSSDVREVQEGREDALGAGGEDLALCLRISRMFVTQQQQKPFAPQQRESWTYTDRPHMIPEFGPFHATIKKWMRRESRENRGEGEEGLSDGNCATPQGPTQDSDNAQLNQTSNVTQQGNTTPNTTNQVKGRDHFYTRCDGLFQGNDLLHDQIS